MVLQTCNRSVTSRASASQQKRNSSRAVSFFWQGTRAIASIFIFFLTRQIRRRTVKNLFFKNSTRTLIFGCARKPVTLRRTHSNLVESSAPVLLHVLPSHLISFLHLVLLFR